MSSGSLEKIYKYRTWDSYKNKIRTLLFCISQSNLAFKYKNKKDSFLKSTYLKITRTIFC